MSRGETEVFSGELARGPGSRFWEWTQRAQPPVSALYAKSPCVWISLSLTLAWAHRTGFPGGSGLKESTCKAGNCLKCSRWNFGPWVGKIPWRRNGRPLQYSCLENPMDRGDWRATVHGVPRARQDLASKPLPCHPRTYPSRFLFSHLLGDCCLRTGPPARP